MWARRDGAPRSWARRACPASSPVAFYRKARKPICNRISALGTTARADRPPFYHSPPGGANRQTQTAGRLPQPGAPRRALSAGSALGATRGLMGHPRGSSRNTIGTRTQASCASPPRRAGVKRQVFTVASAAASSELDPLERSSDHLARRALGAHQHAQRDGALPRRSGAPRSGKPAPGCASRPRGSRAATPARAARPPRTAAAGAGACGARRAVPPSPRRREPRARARSAGAGPPRAPLPGVAGGRGGDPAAAAALAGRGAGGGGAGGGRRLLDPSPARAAARSGPAAARARARARGRARPRARAVQHDARAKAGRHEAGLPRRRVEDRDHPRITRPRARLP